MLIVPKKGLRIYMEEKSELLASKKVQEILEGKVKDKLENNQNSAKLTEVNTAGS